MKNPKLFELVYELVKKIPEGKVATYGDIANIIGISPRFVGYVLHKNPFQNEVYCFRVVSASGRVADSFAFGGAKAQKKLLESEGVIFKKGKVDLDKFRHNF